MCFGSSAPGWRRTLQHSIPGSCRMRIFGHEGRIFACAANRPLQSRAHSQLSAKFAEAQKQGRLHWLVLAAALPVLGGAVYTVWDKQLERLGHLRKIDDNIFNTTDNLFVFFHDSVQDSVDRRVDVIRIIQTLRAERSLHRLRFYFNVRKTDDPPIPEGSNAKDLENECPLRVVMYKGHRKEVIHIGKEVPLNAINDFFTPVSEDDSALQLSVPRVCGKAFHDQVVEKSSPARPVLVQLFEDSCFLCFLMRPLVNSIAELFIHHKVHLRINRFNVETNDLPDDCPVSRGTPTFVLFRGRSSPPARWEEFRPKEIVEKILDEFPGIPDYIRSEMFELQDLVPKRFELFTQNVMWTVECGRLQALLSSTIGEPVKSKGANSTTEEEKTQALEEKTPLDPESDELNMNIISHMMLNDMKRHDNMHDNIAFLQREVDEVEADAAALGTLLAHKLMEYEEKERIARAGVLLKFYKMVTSLIAWGSSLR